MHVCHQQLYWEKRNENDNDNITWTRSEYVDYVAEQIDNIPVATKFLECFRQNHSRSSETCSSNRDSNDQPRGPPETDDDKKINALRKKSLKDLRSTLKKRRPRMCPLPRRARHQKEKFSPNQCQRSTKVPQGRLNLQKHPIPILPLLRRQHPQNLRGDTGVPSFGLRLGEKYPRKLRSSLKTLKPHRSSTLSSRKRPKKSSGSSARLVHSVAPTLMIVAVQKPCFGVIPADSPFALNAAPAA